MVAAVAATGLESGTAAAADPKRSTHAVTTTHTVVIEGVRFDPQELAVKVGDTIVWINHDPFPHTVTAADKTLDSHEIAAGRSWKYTVKKAGVLAYACSLHPTMLGTLRVE